MALVRGLGHDTLGQPARKSQEPGLFRESGLPFWELSKSERTPEPTRRLARIGFVALGAAVGLGLALPAYGQEAAEVVTTPVRSAPQGFFGIVFSGGPVGIAIMLVLIAMSLTAAYLVFEQFLLLRRKLLLPTGLNEQVRQQLQSGNLSEAEQLCQRRPSLLSAILLQGLAEADSEWPELEKALEDALAEQSARLMRRIELISVMANLAPMVGLLGTVVGMVMAFKQVADTRGTANAADLAEGIYTALVTTVAGLIIAIPSLGAYAMLRNRVDELLAEAAYEVLHVFRPLKARRGASKPPPLPPRPPSSGAP